LNLKTVAGFFPVVILAVLVSVHFFDGWIALQAQELLKSGVFLEENTADIPDVLFLLSWSGSCLLLGNYFILQRKGISNENTRFFLLAGYAIPCAYFLKWIFKLVFGRTNTRVWLENRVNDGFHWFHGGGDYSGFPSGHMAVFTAFFAAIWLFYPRCRSLSISLSLVLAVALIATDYHFLSDVVAGAYLGLIATCITKVCIERITRRQPHIL
jgi:membrane-associated phospholipid phosphatase